MQLSPRQTVLFTKDPWTKSLSTHLCDGISTRRIRHEYTPINTQTYKFYSDSHNTEFYLSKKTKHFQKLTFSDLVVQGLYLTNRSEA